MNIVEDAWVCPNHVAVIGGGRWARVLLETLCGIVPLSTTISAHSSRNAQAMMAWATERGLGNRILVSPDYPEAITLRTSAVIVANAARDHEKAIEWALSRHLPVLVEKPVTLSFAATGRMANFAITQNTYLAAAHVFLFARYVTAFSKLVNESGAIQSICVQWSDPRAESRYGEAKSYDPSLTVYADWLPHVLSILGALSPNPISLGSRSEVLRGGAQLKMDVRLGDIPCEIELVRNGTRRQRRIEVVTRNGLNVLDFANEPGAIISNALERSGDPAWDIEPKPVATMLRAFLRGAAGDVRDERLDIRLGLQANQVIEQLSSPYNAALAIWLGEKCLTLGEEADADLRYALSELLYVDDPLSSIPVEKRIEYIHRNLKATLMSSLGVEYGSRPVELVRLLIKQGKTTSYL